MSHVKTVIATARNEGPFLLEWIAYHRAIGFDHIVILSEPSVDQTEGLLQKLAQAGAIVHVPSNDQTSAESAAMKLPEVRDADWLLTLSIAEYLNIHAGSGTLSDLFSTIDRIGDCDALCLGRRVFGNAGHTRFLNRLLLPRFTRAAPAGPAHPAQRQFRTFVKPAQIARLKAGSPIFKPTDAAVVWRNGAGKDISGAVTPETALLSPDSWGQTLAQINYYPIRSNAVFALHHLQDPPLSDQTLTLMDHTQLNTNHVEDNTIAALSQGTTREIKRLQGFAGVQAAHKDCVKAFETLIAESQSTLTATDRRDLRVLFDAERAKKIVASQAAQARDGRVRLNTATPPRMRITTDTSPAWLSDMRQTPHKRGWYYGDDTFAVQMTTRGNDVLILTFDCSVDSADQTAARTPWGYTMIRDAGWSHMGVMAFAPNWYRDGRLFNFLAGQVQSGVFAQFETVVLTGAEMGGYAATAFAGLVPDCRVLVFAPQATLAADLVPWETRFASGRQADWSGQYRDAPAECAAAGEVYILSDPGSPADRKHADLFDGSNVMHLNSWYAPTMTAARTLDTDIIAALLGEVVSGMLTPARFYQIYRTRRSQPWYAGALAERVLAKGHHGRAKRLAHVLRQRGREDVAKDIENRL